MQGRQDRTNCFSAISEYIGKLQENENVFQEIEVNKRAEKRSLNSELDKDRQELVKIQKKIDVMEENIPQAMTGSIRCLWKTLCV